MPLSERPSTATQPGVIVQGQRQPRRAQHALAERFGLEQGQMAHRTRYQDILNRQLPRRCRVALWACQFVTQWQNYGMV